MSKIVYRFKFILLCLACILFSQYAIAQEDEGDPLAPEVGVIKSRVPLDTLIRIKLLSRDTVSFDYYSLYAFEYNNGKEKLNHEFMIPRKDDVYRNRAMQTIEIKLCKVTQFINSWKGIPSPPVEIGDYIEITRDNGKDKQYYNFDTSLPHAVYGMCAPKEQNKDKR